MKNIFILNLFFVGLPIALCLLGFINCDFVIWGLLSTLLTGVFQFIVVFKMLLDEPKDKFLQLYALSVILFFIIWFSSYKIGYYDIFNYLLLSIPPILAIYLSVLMYKKI